MITVKINVDKVIAALRKKGTKLNRELKNSVIRGVRYFGGKMIKTQMTGRPHLKVGTGNLRRSWFTRIHHRARGGFSVTWATRTVYARIHQYGGVITQQKRSIRIPKRLFILEKFRSEGMRDIEKVVARRVLPLIRRGLAA